MVIVVFRSFVDGESSWETKRSRGGLYYIRWLSSRYTGTKNDAEAMANASPRTVRRPGMHSLMIVWFNPVLFQEFVITVFALGLACCDDLKAERNNGMCPHLVSDLLDESFRLHKPRGTVRRA